MILKMIKAISRTRKEQLREQDAEANMRYAEGLQQPCAPSTSPRARDSPQRIPWSHITHPRLPPCASFALPTLLVPTYFSRLLSASLALLSFHTHMPPPPLHRAIAVVLLVAVIGSGIDAANLRSGSSEEVRRPPCYSRVVVVLW